VRSRAHRVESIARSRCGKCQPLPELQLIPCTFVCEIPPARFPSRVIREGTLLPRQIDDSSWFDTTRGPRRGVVRGRGNIARQLSIHQCELSKSSDVQTERERLRQDEAASREG
jgi:hypothetical protein